MRLYEAGDMTVVVQLERLGPHGNGKASRLRKIDLGICFL